MASCVFCDIVSKKATSTIEYEDDEFLAFKDIYPVAEVHILVIPKQHVSDITALNHSHIAMVEKMEKIARDLLATKGKTDPTQQRIGFHWGKLAFVRHLHLHCIGLPYTSYLKSFAFDYEWILPSPQSVIQDLKKSKI
eukprot:TRINITY_DN4927_c0_g1_i1.p1 TRINITY_DN4927_c0_g1~~TRINITY_DN4927_c0_g1_i1.p1  ORF type:complete len:159 (-),score=26.67 TRINITY_DN4927_c0_g1_i1:102-515(-)